MSEELFKTAFRHHQAGRLEQAQDLYRQVLKRSPEHEEALHLLGVLLHQHGDNAEAAKLIEHAIRIDPGRALFRYNLGTVYQALQREADAEDSFRKALELKPDQAEAWFNLGAILQGRGELDTAIKNYQRAIEIRPSYTRACMSLAQLLQDAGRANEAIDKYRCVVTLNPSAVDAWNRLGNLLRQQGRLDEAMACCRKAQMLSAGNAETLHNLGLIHWAQGNLQQAIDSFNEALSIRETAGLYNNRGQALRAQGRMEEALASLRKALELKPDFTEAYSGMLFLCAYHAILGHQEYLDLARGWEIACVSAAEREVARQRRFDYAPVAGRRLRVAYISGDFRRHAMSYFIEQLFANHDRERVELFAYSTERTVDAVTERIRGLVEHWLPVFRLDDDGLRERIEADRIDVLVDLSGHTAHNRMGVIARRAAPVQVHYLGYFASTGMSGMDYMFSDAELTPPETDVQYSERIWRLPRIRASYAGSRDLAESGWHPDMSGSLWLGNFCNIDKITPQSLALWAKVLHALPQAKLLLKNNALADLANRRRIQEAMAKHGIAAEQVELRDSRNTVGWEEHMAYYDRLDVVMDPVGAHGGYTTTCDALWMGAPVVTLEGDRMASRMTASILATLGHPEWIAQSEQEYVERIVQLAQDVELRRQLRPAQRARMAASPLCDARGLAASMEEAYFNMVELARDMKPAASASGG